VTDVGFAALPRYGTSIARSLDMRDGSEVWAIVLAGGNGKRVSLRTRDRAGQAVPKQFAPIVAGSTPLGLALARARRFAPNERIVAVVVSDHEPWWRGALASLRRENILVEPSGRGTAPAVLFGVLHVLARNPAARVIVLPSDHFVASEDNLQDAIAYALSSVAHDRIVLVGAPSRSPDADVGWILPDDGEDPLRRVSLFMEKPDAPAASALFERGAWWNTMIFAATPSSILAAFERALPEVLAPFLDAKSAGGAPSYDRVPRADLCARVFAHSAAMLFAVRAPECGWLDLGSVEHIDKLQHGLGYDRPEVRSASQAVEAPFPPS
jgi:mannose-1-phosphate guanylyltransferase